MAMYHERRSIGTACNQEERDLELALRLQEQEVEERRAWVVKIAGREKKPKLVVTPDSEDVEPARERNTTRRRQSLKTALTNYFNLGICTSDPLLTVAKWIAYVTEIGAVVTVVLPLLIYFLVVITCSELTIFQSFEDFVIFATICLVVGLMAFCYLHYMWVKPSRQLLVGLQQLSTYEFSPWILTAFIHCVPVAYLTYRWNTCHLIHSTPWNPWACGHCIWIALLWILILTPQFIVLAALVRVHRLSNERIRTPDQQSDIPPTTTSPLYVFVFVFVFVSVFWLARSWLLITMTKYFRSLGCLGWLFDGVF